MTNQSYTIFAGDLLIHDVPRVIPNGTGTERGANAGNKYRILERYYNDIYKLFLTKLSKFDSDAVTNTNDRKKLKSLMDEIIYVKGLLEEEK